MFPKLRSPNAVLSLCALALGCSSNAETPGAGRPHRTECASSTPGAGGPSTAGQGGSSASGSGGAGGNSATLGSAGLAGSNGSAGGSTGNAGSTGSAGANPTAGAAGVGSDVVITIENGGFWNDTTGKRIEAHGAGLILDGGTWYWIGEDKSKNSGNFSAVNAYSSKDLSHWKFENAIITTKTSTELAASGRIIERPKVIYNSTTKQYVMWLHWDGNSYGDAEAGVFTCATVAGNYTLSSHFRPNDNMSRDDTLFKDDDGKAYFISAANENADLMMYELSDDYLTIKRQVAKLTTAKREAPAMFKQGGRYFIINSAATGWDSNQAEYFSATSVDGPWTALTKLGNSTTYDTQSAYVIPVQGLKSTTYVYAGDRWQDPDLVSSKYIWLPIKVSGSTLSLDNYDKWQLNVTQGTWSSNVDDGFLPQAGWTLIKADSEETQGEDGHATNAFDGSASTIWHTQYTPTTPSTHTKSKSTWARATA